MDVVPLPLPFFYLSFTLSNECFCYVLPLNIELHSSLYGERVILYKREWSPNSCTPKYAQVTSGTRKQVHVYSTARPLSPLIPYHMFRCCVNSKGILLSTGGKRNSRVLASTKNRFIPSFSPTPFLPWALNRRLWMGSGINQISY